MFSYVNQATRRWTMMMLLWSLACWSYAESIRFPLVLPEKVPNPATQPYYSFSYEDMDRMLQLIEKYRNFRPSNIFLDYGVSFFPELDPSTNKLRLVAKACVIMPQEAVPLNMAGNYFPGNLNGEDFFDADFMATFKKSPAQANGAPQAYTFAVLMESQVQFLLAVPGTVGIKAYQAKVDYGSNFGSATTSVFFNLNMVTDIPEMSFGAGAKFMLAWPCPPFWKTDG